MIIEEATRKINKINHIDYKMYQNYDSGIINVTFYNRQYARCRKMITNIVEQFAKEQAVEFAEWTYIACYEPIDVNKWKRWYTSGAIRDAKDGDINLDQNIYSTQELFEKFIKEWYDQFKQQS